MSLLPTLLVPTLLNADMDNLVVMRLVGEDVTLMCEVEHSFREHVVREGGKDVLYLRLDKALYGCVQSALLWYNLFSKTLKAMGFVLNRYDPCVANTVFNNKQCTITWYVDVFVSSFMWHGMVVLTSSLRCVFWQPGFHNLLNSQDEVVYLNTFTVPLT